MWVLLCVKLAWASCRDSTVPYVGDWGEKCTDWKGKDCTLLPEARGASTLGRQLLRCRCPVMCKVDGNECFARDDEGRRYKLGYPTVCPVCKEDRAGRHHNNCEVKPLRKRGETCVFNYQCVNSYCCPHLRVCLDGDKDRLSIPQLEALNTVEIARIIASPPENRRACEPTVENLSACLQDAAAPYGSVSPMYSLTRCNCKASFLFMVHRNMWVPCPAVPEESMLCTDFNWPPPPPPEESNTSATIAGLVIGAFLLICAVSYSMHRAKSNAKRIAAEESVTIERERERRSLLVMELTAAAEAREEESNQRRKSIQNLNSSADLQKFAIAIEAGNRRDPDASSSSCLTSGSGTHRSYGEDTGLRRLQESPAEKRRASLHDVIQTIMSAPLGATDDAEKEARALAGIDAPIGRERQQPSSLTVGPDDAATRKSWVLVKSAVKQQNVEKARKQIL